MARGELVDQSALCVEVWPKRRHPVPPAESTVVSGNDNWATVDFDSHATTLVSDTGDTRRQTAGFLMVTDDHDAVLAVGEKIAVTSGGRRQDGVCNH